MKNLYLLAFASVFSFFAFGAGAKPPAECLIADVTATVQPCDESGNFYVLIDFEYQNTGEMGFRVQGNGNNYGNFGYDGLPVTIGPLAGDGTTIYEFVVIDNQFEDCSDWTAIDPVDCNPANCHIWDVTAVPQPCDDNGNFMVQLYFLYENIGEAGFTVNGNGNNYGTFEYADLPVMIGPLAGDGVTVYEFGVTDNQHPDCTDWTAIDPVDCNGGGEECSIDDLDITVLPCNDAGFFNVLLDFEYQNTGELGFHVQGNGTHYGDYDYEDLPIEIGPLEGNGVTVYEFLVKDNQVEGCMQDDFIEPVNCGDVPQFDNLSLDVATCSSGEFYLALDFEPVNMMSDTFSFYANGILSGKYLFSDLPMSLGPWPADGATNYNFMVRESGLERYGDWEKLWAFTCETLVVDEHDAMQPSVRPNPTKGEVTIDIGIDKPAYVNIYDLTGKSIMERSFSGKTELDISTNPHGLYIVRITVGKQIFLKKLIFR